MFKEQVLNKNKLISLVKTKLDKAKNEYNFAQKKLNETIKSGNKQEIYFSAYNAAETKDRYANLYLLYYELTKEKQNG